MKEFIPVLKRTKLFSGVGDDDISTMLTCLGARLLTYKKGEHVLRQGEHLSDILVLAEGSLHIQRDDYWVFISQFCPIQIEIVSDIIRNFVARTIIIRH